MGYFQQTQDSKTFKWSYIRDISLALSVEVSEFLQELPWKPWSHNEDASYDEIKAAKEICDIIVFALVLWITLDPKADIDEMMESTFKKVEDRIKDLNYGFNRT